MSTVEAALAALAGVVTFLGAAYALIRGVARQSAAVEANTRAVEKLTTAVERLDNRVDVNDRRIDALEEWRRLRGRRLWVQARRGARFCWRWLRWRY